MFPVPIQQRSNATRVVYHIAIWITVILWMLPLLAIFLTSMRSIADINMGNYWGIPTEIHIVKNYTAVFTQTPMLRYFINSLLVTIPAVLLSMIISSMAGFTLAVHAFKGRILLFALFIAGNFVPFQILMIPVRSMMITLGLYDSLWSLIIFHIAFQSGFATFFLRNFIASIPSSLFENARIEGASEWRIYFQLVLPLLRPAIAALSILLFTFIWNDFFWALILVQSDAVRPITVRITDLARTMDCIMEFTFCWLYRRSPATCYVIFYCAKTVHTRTFTWRRKRIITRYNPLQPPLLTRIWAHITMFSITIQRYPLALLILISY